MIKESHLELVRTKGSKFGRVLMGLLFLISGISMATDLSGAAGYMTMLGVPMAGLAVYAVVAVKIIAGGAIVLGKRTTEAAAALIIFTLVATILAHISPDIDATFPIGLLKNLAIVGGLLYLMAFGPHGTNVLGDDPGELTSKTA